ncbi:glycosyltransferase family 2 protein [Endomicrobium proavitum]|nr:glycosyltransferase family 2 protein [Endomicrobium proavitum]
MKTNPLVSICCLSYQHSRYIEQNIKAIWGQDYKNVEILALDDGSKDNSAQILNELEIKSPFKMTALSQSNSGNVGKNFNVMLRRAQGKYILFMSCDDVLTKNAIKEKVDILEEDGNISFVVSKKYLVIDGKGRVNARRSRGLQKSVSSNLQDNINIDQLIDLEYKKFGSFFIQGALFRKSVVDAVGGFDEDMVGDDIVLRTKIFNYVKEHELSFKILNTCGFLYRNADGNLHKNAYRQIKTVAQVLERFFPDKENPPVLADWMRGGFDSMPFEKAYTMFDINGRTSAEYKNVLQLMLKRSNKIRIYRKRFKVVCLFAIFSLILNAIFIYLILK